MLARRVALLKSSTAVIPPDGRLVWASIRRVLCEGDSISAQQDGRSMAAWLTLLSGGLMTFVANDFTPTGGNKAVGTTGVGGKKIADRTADLAAMKAVNTLCNTLIVHLGTNNLSDSYASMQTDFLAFLVEAKAQGFDVVYSQILKRNDATGIAQNQKRVDFNTWTETLVGNSTYSLLASVSHDATFDPVANPEYVNTADQLHPTYLGTKIFCQNIVNKLNFGSTTLNSLLPATTVSNANLAGTTGTLESSVTGQVPTGWRADNDAGCTAVAAVGVSGGENYFEMVLSGVASTTNPVRMYRSSDAGIQLALDEWSDGAMYIDLTNGAGNGPPVGINGWTAFVGNGGTFRTDHPASTYGNMDLEIHQDVRCLPLKADGVVNGTVGLYIRLVAGTVDVKARISKIRASKGAP